MSIPELVHLVEEATKLENSGNLQGAYDKCMQVVNDPQCPKPLQATAEKILERLGGNQHINIGYEEPEGEMDKIFNVDVFALEAIPAIENKMPITQTDYERIKEGIKRHGINNPLVALPDFRLVCGYNRWKAAKELELKTVPVIFRHIPHERIVEYAMKDNTDRRQLAPKQIIEYISKLKTQGMGRPRRGSRKKTVEDIAEVLGVSERTVERAKKFIKTLKAKPELQGQSIRSVLEGSRNVASFTSKYEYIIGVGTPEQAMIDNSAEVINKIFAFDPRPGDKIKTVTTVYIYRRC